MTLHSQYLLVLLSIIFLSNMKQLSNFASTKMNTHNSGQITLLRIFGLSTI